MRNLSDEAREMRVMGTIRELSPEMLARLTQIDDSGAMALVAET